MRGREKPGVKTSHFRAVQVQTRLQEEPGGSWSHIEEGQEECAMDWGRDDDKEQMCPGSGTDGDQGTTAAQRQ